MATGLDARGGGAAGGDAVVVRTEPEHFRAVEALCARVYPREHPWTAAYLAAHRERFPEGQLVALVDGDVVGMAASLLLPAAEEEADAPYAKVTGGFRFDNHDPAGTTLYGAEVMVDPAVRRRGVGRALYAARRALAGDVGARRIRAAARLAGYGSHASRLAPEAYAAEVLAGRLRDATLSFQLHQGFTVVKHLPRYFPVRDPESHGEAVLIEWTRRGAP